MTKKPASVALLLDNSGSMSALAHGNDSQLRLLKSDANGFIAVMNGTGKVNSQFHQVGLINFNTDAHVLFSLQAISSVKVMFAGFKAVNSLAAGGVTNIADAIQKGKTMLTPVDTNTYNPAMVLFSDGAWNEGSDPTQNLPSGLPIYTIGYSNYSDLSYLKTISAQTHATYHVTGNPAVLSTIFNDIVNSTRVATTVTNITQNLHPYLPSPVPIQVSQGTDYALFSFNWLEKGFAYTDYTPGDKEVQIVLNDPNGQTVTPDSVEAPDNQGFAVLRVDDPAPGQWSVYGRYGDLSVDQIGNAVGGFVPPDSISLSLAHIDAAQDPSISPHILAQITDDQEPLKDIKVKALAVMPLYSRQQLFDRFGNELKQILDQGEFSSDANPEEAALNVLRNQLLGQEDIFFHQRALLDVAIDFEQGKHQIKTDQLRAGLPHNIYVEVSGYSPKSDKHFARTQLITVVS
ncbi:MAG: VWA domain-containing protein [Cyanobacteria bacterium P01_G01_bin.54]